jgi:hypothetical protein
MLRELSIPLQTIYAELLERCATAEMAEAFAEPGSFVSKEVRGRRYWYFQRIADRSQAYVGPESKELLERIAAWRQDRSAVRERRELVTALRRAGVPGPDAATGRALKALADGGVFRLRAVLVGTLAYQTYAPLLGVKLPGASIRTGDIDIAQLHEISIALDDAAPPPLELLQRTDPSFRPVPSLDRRTTAFAGAGGVRVEFLAPKKRSEERVWLKALRTHAQALSYLDYILQEPQQAVVLAGAGVLVNVPDPARYAWHKLVIATLRRNRVKARKDVQQAALLMEHLLRTDAARLRQAWTAFTGSGRGRRKLVEGAMKLLPAQLRDFALAEVVAGAA